MSITIEQWLAGLERLDDEETRSAVRRVLAALLEERSVYETALEAIADGRPNRAYDPWARDIARGALLVGPRRALRACISS